MGFSDIIPETITKATPKITRKNDQFVPDYGINGGVLHQQPKSDRLKEVSFSSKAGILYRENWQIEKLGVGKPSSSQEKRKETPKC